MRVALLALVVACLAYPAFADAIIVTNTTHNPQRLGVEYRGKSFFVTIAPRSYHILRGKGLVLFRNGQEPMETRNKEEYAILPNNKLIRTKIALEEEE